MDILALVNSGVNFILYCFMSAQFRKTFSQLFCIRWTERGSASIGLGTSATNRRNCPRPEATFATELLGTYHGETSPSSPGSDKITNLDKSTNVGVDNKCSDNKKENGPLACNGIIERDTPEIKVIYSVAKEEDIQFIDENAIE